MSTGLANLVAELEFRLTGSSEVERLDPGLAAGIPESPTYVLALFDGLGSRQLGHRRALSLAAGSRGSISAPFPTTTTVAMSTIATGTHPVTHGIIGHQMWVPELEAVVNVLKWIGQHGSHIDFDTTGYLPGPNLWERLSAGGIEPVTVQPAHFATSPLTQMLYRGCRFEPVHTDAERLEATLDLAREPGRLVFVYFAEVDFAAHVAGQASAMYDDAVSQADTAWSILSSRLPQTATLVATADHGHVDFSPDQKLLVRDPAYRDLVFFGDPRAVMVRGDRDLIDRLAEETGSTVVDRPELIARLGEGDPHPGLDDRLPDALLDPPADRILLPRGFDKRLTGYHGGLTPAEVDVPLLVASPGVSR